MYSACTSGQHEKHLHWKCVFEIFNRNKLTEECALLNRGHSIHPLLNNAFDFLGNCSRGIPKNCAHAFFKPLINNRVSTRAWTVLDKVFLVSLLFIDITSNEYDTRKLIPVSLRNERIHKSNHRNDNNRMARIFSFIPQKNTLHTLIDASNIHKRKKKIVKKPILRRHKLNQRTASLMPI